MSEGKYLSLEEARRTKELLKRFAKEHPSKGNETVFDNLLSRMAIKMKPEGHRTSRKG